MPSRAAVLAVGVVLVACTATDPSPGSSPGTTAGSASPVATADGRAAARAGVVLAPPDAGPAATTSAALAGTGPSGVRLVEPPSESFRRDLLVLLASERTPLVCTVGDEGADDLVDLAASFPTTRFCLLDGRLDDPPARVVPVVWPLDEGGRLAGAFAARLGPGPIAVVSPIGVRNRETVRAAVEAGARTVRPGATVRLVAGLPGREPATIVVPYGAPAFLHEVLLAASLTDRRVIGLGIDLRTLADDATADAIAGSVTRDLVAGLEAAARADAPVTLPWRSP